MPTESQIRDKLAARLTLLEPGLTLIGTEVQLNNPAGAKGFVDILARDGLGNRVVIEIKKSDASARAALHEIYKYLAILQLEQSIPSHKLRCLLLSTNWHELLVPFSEFVRTSPYQVEGRQIHVDDTGEVTSVEAIVLQSAPVELTVFRHHDILLFADRTLRDNAIPQLTSALDMSGARLAFVLSLDYHGENPHVVYPFALYVAVARADSAALDALRQKLIEEGDWSDEMSDIEKQLLLAQSFSGEYLERFSSHETYEIGYPEKYLSIRRSGWSVSTLRRHGAEADRLGLTDDEIHTLITGEEGNNQTIYHRISSPKLHASWEDMRRKASHSLVGNDTWQQDFDRFLDLAAATHPTHALAVRIYNPVHTIRWFIKLLRDGDPRYVPAMELVVSAGDQKLAYLTGFVENWSPPRVDSVEELLEGIASDPFDLLLRHQLGVGWQQDSEIMHRLGLRYTSIQFSLQHGTEPVAETFSADRLPSGLAWNNNLSTTEIVTRYRRCAVELLDSIFDAFGAVMTEGA